MTRIVLDPTELAGAASELHGAAGEYEAIGTQAASCNCGCMPADVAATVDATTAAIRSRLSSLAGAVAAEGSELAWRADVPQDGSAVTSAVSSASGPGVASSGGSTLTIGGDPYGLFQPQTGGSTLTIGGDPYGLFQPQTGGSTLTIGGDPYGLFSPQSGSAGGTLTIGGDPYGNFSQSSSGGTTLVINPTPLWEPGEEEALQAAVERSMPLWQFFPRGIGVNINPPGAFLFQHAYGFSDALNHIGYNAWTDPRGSTPSYYNPYLNERVYFP